MSVEKSVPPANYTTVVPVTRTLSEIQDMLVKRGVQHVATEFLEGLPCGLSFTLSTPQGEKVYRLPVEVDAMHRLLCKIADEGHGALGTKPDTLRRTTIDHAARVSWRVVRDWIRAQLTLVDAEMAKLDQVFLPYMVLSSGDTVFQVFEQSDLQLEGSR